MSGCHRKLGGDGQRVLIETVMKFHMNPTVIYQQQRETYLRALVDHGILGTIETQLRDKMGSGDDSIFRGMDLIGAEDQRRKEIERMRAKEKYMNDNDWSPLLKGIVPRIPDATEFAHRTNQHGESQNQEGSAEQIRTSETSQELFPGWTRLDFTKSALNSQPEIKSLSNSSGSSSIFQVPCAQRVPKPSSLTSCGSTSCYCDERNSIFTNDLSKDSEQDDRNREKRKQPFDISLPAKRLKIHPDVADKAVQMPSQHTLSL